MSDSSAFFGVMLIFIIGAAAGITTGWTASNNAWIRDCKVAGVHTDDKTAYKCGPITKEK